MLLKETHAIEEKKMEKSGAIDAIDSLITKFRKDMKKVRGKFDARYKESAFSKDFLGDTNLSQLFRVLMDTDMGDLNLAEEIIAFVVRYDDVTGYPSDPRKRMGALREARDKFKRSILHRAEQEAWDRRMKVVNEGLQNYCPDLVRKRESYVQPEDMSRAEGADRIRTRMAAAMRCRVFNTPKAFASGSTTFDQNKNIDLDSVAKMCDCSFGTDLKELPGKCTVPQPSAPRGYLAGTPVMYYNVRDIDKDRPMPSSFSPNFSK